MSIIQSTVHSMERNLHFLKIARIFYAILFTAPILIIYYGTKELSFSDFLKIQVLVPITMMLLEIPAGYLGDKYKRRSIYLTGAFSIVLGNVWMYFAQGMFELSFVFILHGIGFALHRGSSGAILYDSLLNIGREKEHNLHYSQISKYSKFSIAISAIFSGFLFSIHIDLPILLQCISGFIFIFYAFQVVEPERHETDKKPISVADFIQIFKYVFFEHKDLKWVMILGSVLAAASFKAFWLMQPFIESLGFSVIWLGLAAALQNFIIGFIVGKTSFLKDKFNSNRILAFAILFSCSGFMFSGLLSGVASISMLIFIFAAFGLSQVLIQTMVNERTSSEIRTTTLAISSSVMSVAMFSINYLFATLLDNYGMATSLITMSVVVAVICIPALIFIKIEKKL